MIKFRSVFCVMALICLERVVIPSASIQFDKTEWDIGDVQLAQSVKAVLPFLNAGDQELQIIRIDNSCGCIEAKSGMSKLAPGQSSNIEVVFRPTGSGGLLTKTVSVVSNDPAHPITRLTVNANAIPLAVLSPEQLNFGTINQGAVINRSITLTPSNLAGFSIKSIKSSGSRVTPSFLSPKNGENSFKINVKISAGEQTGRIVERLTIVTGLPNNPTIDYIVYGNVVEKDQPNGK